MANTCLQISSLLLSSITFCHFSSAMVIIIAIESSHLPFTHSLVCLLAFSSSLLFPLILHQIDPVFTTPVPLILCSFWRYSAMPATCCIWYQTTLPARRSDHSKLMHRHFNLRYDRIKSISSIIRGECYFCNIFKFRHKAMHITFPCHDSKSFQFTMKTHFIMIFCLSYNAQILFW